MTSAWVDRWVTGWCNSRQMQRCRDGDSWLVEVGADDRSQERIASTASLTEIDRLVAVTSAPDVRLTLIGELDASMRDAVAVLDPANTSECMMSAPIRPGIVPAEVEIEQDGRVAYARIHMDGELAAHGQVAVAAGDAVFDRIRTMSAFQRRGLGRLIMTGLAAWAAEQRATTGILVASADGRKLYESLGWSQVAPIAMFRGRGDERG
ncbi:GNAT family N-acetyltransferase [Microbacterium sp. 2P01SA-2]|uniref:GNAT family N-acetyltransferase n=1 Tax=unclassified Microbacterium TaxID=2609290 RepID=UPI0039A3D61B